MIYKPHFLYPDLQETLKRSIKALNQINHLFGDNGQSNISFLSNYPWGFMELLNKCLGVILGQLQTN